MYEKLQSFLAEHQIKMGRDALFNLLAYNNLLVRRRKRRAITTFSQHWYKKYPNLIKDILPSRPNEIWVSDITYWKINIDKYLYISLITDAYSKKIVGYHVANNLEAIGCLRALRMAISELKEITSNQLPLYHHSDRGIQYCSKEYVRLLEDNGIGISMTESGDPRDNAIAERVNGIIKNEYLEAYVVDSEQEASQLLDQVIILYNKDRPHMSLGNMRPDFVHQYSPPVTRLWKNYYPAVKQIQDQDEIVNCE